MKKTTMHVAKDMIFLTETPTAESTYTVYEMQAEDVGLTVDTMPDAITWNFMLFERSEFWNGYVTYHQPNENVVLKVYHE